MDFLDNNTNTFTTDCTYILPTKKEKERKKFPPSKSVREKKKKDHSCFSTFKLQLINAPFFRVEKFRKFSVLTN